MIIEDLKLERDFDAEEGLYIKTTTMPVTTIVEQLKTILLFAQENPTIYFTGDNNDHKDQAIEVLQANAMIVRDKVEHMLKEIGDE